MDSESATYKSLVVPGVAAEIESACQMLLADAADNGFDDDDIFGIHLALEEAFVNAIKHGNKQDPYKNVTIKYLVSPDRFDVFISDEGGGFNPDSLPDPRIQENLLKSSGRGVLLMSSYMDQVEYNQAGNCVHMVKQKTKI